MTDELRMLAQAHEAYLKAPTKVRAFYERLIDNLSEMIAEGRTFEHPDSSDER